LSHSVRGKIALRISIAFLREAFYKWRKRKRKPGSWWIVS
jgi:hypothetical protein